jgi:hypothetical protein
MKRKLVVLLMLSFSSITHAMTIEQKENAIQNIRAEANQAMENNASGLAKYNNDRANFTAADSAKMRTASDTLKSAQARIDAIRAEPTTSLHATATITPIVHMASLTTSTPSINVSISSLKPSTPISVTVNGVTKTVAASTLAPSTQVAVPHIPAFERNPGKGSSNDQGASHSVGGGGNGDNNAANTSSAHGLGGGAHIGGGSAMGGGFHGQW